MSLVKNQEKMLKVLKKQVVALKRKEEAAHKKLRAALGEIKKANNAVPLKSEKPRTKRQIKV